MAGKSHSALALPLTLEGAASAAAGWLWEKYGKDIADKALDEVKERWNEFRWKEAELRYRARVKDLYSTTRLLGNPKPIVIEDVFTDVYVLDKPTAFQRYDLNELQKRPFERDSLRIKVERRPALRVALSNRRLYILGKPGAGKTTFLKYLTLLACDGKIQKTPLFVSLKEWSDSKLELMPFLVKQFEICAFPDAAVFITHLLEKGDALVLFDGLDEVRQENEQRNQTIATLVNFAKQYPDAQICMTCRIASTDYSFEQFTYMEIADFDEKQMQVFVRKWYQEEPQRLEHFQAEFDKPENAGIRELAQTPLLLALLCLAFDETLSFPMRRVDLYREALDALLRKWDSSRLIRRDEIYHHLPVGRKLQMLAAIAAENFEAGNYFIHEDLLVDQIARYLSQLSSAQVGDFPDGLAVLKALEERHGILVERAHKIYSFSHLTFQEYFTAQYIVENASDGTVSRLVSSHFGSDRWREVFLLTASLLNNGDDFLRDYFRALDNLVAGNRSLNTVLHLVDQAILARWSRASQRIRYLVNVFIQAKAKAAILDQYLKHAHSLISRLQRVNRGQISQLTLDLKADLDKGIAIAKELDPNSTVGFLHVATHHEGHLLDEELTTASYVLERQLSKGLGINSSKIEQFDDLFNLAIERTSHFIMDLDYLTLLAQELSSRLESDAVSGEAASLEQETAERLWRAVSTGGLEPLYEFLEANRLLVDCIELAAVSNRQALYSRIFAPTKI